MNVVILPRMPAATGSGPVNGMYALQEVLRRRVRERGIDWITISDELLPGHLPWLWSWRDMVADVVAREEPFIMGPNVIFGHSRYPRCDEVEARILDARSCEAIFCHASWYRDLIREHMGPENRARIWCWPYPVHPLPGPPEPRAEWDVMIFVKSGPEATELAGQVAERFRRSRIVRYGQFRREELYAWGRRSRACLYLCDDESGGLATQELMLAGCPVVGIERGCPLVVHEKTGIRIRTWGLESFARGIEQALELDRDGVRRVAMEIFDEERIATTVIGHLDAVRRKHM